jgi:DNA-binding response OmpR family regulator
MEHRNTSILIIDDDVPFASSLQKTLRKIGHETTVCDNAAEALHLLAASVFDLVITDLRLGASSGLEVISSVRRRGIQSKILLLTAFGDEQLSAHARELGADGCLSKPVKRGEILGCVTRLLAETPDDRKAGCPTMQGSAQA